MYVYENKCTLASFIILPQEIGGEDKPIVNVLLTSRNTLGYSLYSYNIIWFRLD